MNSLRKILYPLALVYGEIIHIRNKAFDKGILKSVQFSIPIIGVGNLNVGGTGKSPQIEYLIRLLTSSYNLAVLSRGYGRKTKGFYLGDKTSNADQLGDEPLQFKKKFPDVWVAVDEKRVRGINTLQKINDDLELVLLDDVYQHRYVQAGMYILLTSYDNLYADDMVLPAGDLREKKSGARRAQIVLVTKCPENISLRKREEIRAKLSLDKGQSLFFTCIEYENQIVSSEKIITIKDLAAYKVLLVSGIANPKPLEKFLIDKGIDFEHLKYADHYRFDQKDEMSIYNKFEAIDSSQKIILTTEKDYVRNFLNSKKEVFYLPIKTEFIDKEEDFIKLIYNYVRKDKGNS